MVSLWGRLTLASWITEPLSMWNLSAYWAAFLFSVFGAKMITRHDYFSFRVNEQERQLIEKLGEYLQRNQSDAIRFIIRREVEKLKTAEKRPQEEKYAAAN